MIGGPKFLGSMQQRQGQDRSERRRPLAAQPSAATTPSANMADDCVSCGKIGLRL